MSYQGGKANIGRRIHLVLDMIEDYLFDDEKLPYLEPFVGFCGVMKHFGKEGDRKMTGCDINKDIILMWKAIQQGWKPPTTCSKKKYELLKKSHIHSAERGFIGVVCSYGGIYFVGYRGKHKYAHKTVNSASRGRRVLLKIGKDIKKVKFKHCDYVHLNPKGMLIYVDPPYANNKYTQSDFFKFDHDKFWEKMRQWSRYNLVIISERNAPKDFKCIWKSNRNVTQHGKSTKQVEKLFLYQSIWNRLDSNIKKDIMNV